MMPNMQTQRAPCVECSAIVELGSIFCHSANSLLQRRAFERILAREDTREMLDSLLLHVGTAYETEVWGQVRKFIVLDVINDLLALTIRTCLLHLMSSD